MLDSVPPFLIDLLRLGMWFVFLGLLFVPLERFFPLCRQPVLRPGFVADAGYFFLNGLLPRLLLLPPMMAVAWALHFVVPDALRNWAGVLPLWARIPAAIIAADVGTYWAHRFMHEIPVLWRFHAVHHSAGQIDWLVNTRLHPVDMVLTRLCAFVPIYALGLALPVGLARDPVPLVVLLAGTIWGFFIHANVWWRFGLLEQVISTPCFHHWHHTRRDGPNHNYAAMMPWIDRLFGTFHLPTKAWPAEYGLETPIAADFAGQLLEPFEPARAR